MLKCLLVLSNSTYTIASDEGARLRACVERGDKTVDVQLDMFGEGKLSDVALSVEHIVAIANYPISDMSITSELSDRVTFLRR